MSRIVLLTAAACLLLTDFAIGQQPERKTEQKIERKAFGKNHPFAIDELPDGELKTKINTLSPKAKATAMEWLHTIEFGATDAAKNMRVDDGGGIYIICPLTGCAGCDDHDHAHDQHDDPVPAPEAPHTESTDPESSSSEDPAVPVAAPVPISAPPIYNSRPGSTKHIYLDFNGGLVEGKQWNTSYSVLSWDCRPYDKDGDPTTFSDFEQAEIRRIWERTVEDYSSFDINITTDVFYDPQTVGGYSGNRNVVGWSMFTAGTDKNNVNLPHSSAGGIAYLNVWGRTDYFSRYQPAFTRDYGAADATEAGSHEMGHNLGLSHDGLTTGAEYYGGHAAVSGVATSWGPIMGTGYGRNVTQWSKASEYFEGNRTEDDLSILSTKIGYRPDDNGNTSGTASTLPNGTVNRTGVIERTNDHDFFTFVSGPGTITLNAAGYKTDTSTWGGNLDILLELYDSNLNLIASHNPADQVNAAITQTVPGGTYFLAVKPVGAGSPLTSPRNGYTVYGSLGQYTITGTIPDKQPEIVVEQPVSNSLTDGSATVNCGNINLGSSSSPITFTIRNTGQANLTGLALSKSGTHSADFILGALGSTTLAPGASTTFTVAFTPTGAATRNALLQIASTDLDENPFDINLTGFGVPIGTLAVTEEDYTPTGNYSGPFSPSSKAYTLTNIGSTAINWTAEKNVDWLNLSSPISGSLNPGASTVVTVSLNTTLANSFTIGSYTDTLTFTNITNNNGSTTRAVNLTVNPIPVAITIGNLLQYFDGTQKPVTVTTNPSNKASSVTYNGSSTVPSNAGSYNVAVNITEPNHTGSATATLVIAYNVTYNGNGNTTGTAPASQNKFLDTPLTLATNTGDLIKSGATFAGWNTADNGSGTDYPAGSTYSANASVTLYAKWTTGGNGTWLPTTVGPFNWGDSANWFSGIVASGADNTALFTPNITANQTATLETPRTVGNITFTDSSSSHNLTIAGSNSLTLSRTTGMPVVDVTQSGRTLIISAPTTGIHGLQKNGSGVLELRSISNNFTGGIVLDGGTLSATTNAGSGHFGNNPITVNADATIYTVNTNVNPTTTGITISNASLLNLDTNGSQLTVNGNITGTDARISIGSTTVGGTKTINLNGTSNAFTGTIEFRTPTNSTGTATLNLVSLADSATLGLGNIRFGVSGATGNTTNSHILNIGSGTLAPIVLNNRRIELAGITNSQPNINNNSGQTLTINTDLLLSGGSSKILNLGGTGAGLNTFVGQIGDSLNPTTDTTVLAAGYATGATIIRLASVNGITVGASITGPNIPAGTTVAAVNTSTQEVSLSAATTNSGSLGATITVAGVVGNLAITKNGTGTWILDNPDNTFSGPITLNSTTSSAGTLSFASAAGTNPIFFNQTTSTATLRYTGPGQTMSGIIDARALTSGTITLDASGTGPINYSHPDSLTLVPTSSTIRKLILTGNNADDNILAGVLTNNSGTTNAATLTKNGTGTWVLTGPNAHTGSTAINAGRLFINGDQTAAIGTVTVAANATLGGTGTLGGNTTIAAGGMLEFDLSTPAASHDKLELAATRTLTFSGASTLTITSPGGAAPGSYALATAPGGIVGNAPANLNLPLGWVATVSKVGNDLVLNVTNAPAPSVPSLDVTPPDSFDASGLATGPFTPGSRVYTLTNTGSSLLNWTASDNVTWLDLSPSSGSLAGGASTNVTATINDAANSLPEGTYNGTITFTNSTNGNGNTTRAASLFVQPPATYIVSYLGNGNTDGTAPTNQIKTENIPLTVSGPGTLVRTGYSFASWNTAPDGTGASYAAGASYLQNDAVTLHAQWTPNTYTVTFDPNGGNTPSPSNKQVTFTSTYGTLANVSRTGFVFNGWFTAPIGGTEVIDTTTVTTANNHALFAQWTSGNPEIAVARGATSITVGGIDSITSTVANTAAPLTYTISNSGNFDLLLSNATISGTSNCSVNITTQPASTVAPAGSTNLALSVTPTAAGAWSFSITLPNNDLDENPYVWTVYGVAQGSTTTNFTAVADTYLQEANPATNYGTTPYTFSIYNKTNARRYGLLRFNTSTIPANSTVQSATVSLVKSNTVTGTVNLVAATTSWIESGTGGATWNSMSANLGTSSLGSASATASGTTNIALGSAGITALQNWVNDSTTNHGYGLTTANAGAPTNFIEFHTRENGTSGNHPKLSITYTTTPSVAEMNVTRNAATIADGGNDPIPATIPSSGTPLTYTIANLGNANLILTTPISVSGATNCTVTVNTQPTSPVVAGNTTNLVVTVTPTNTGAWSANLSITNNDPDENPYNWNISGTASGGFLVAYNANNPTSGNPPANQIKLSDVPLTLASNTGSLARLGYTFAGWNTAADGSGTTYDEGATYTANAELSLFAKWTVNTYTVNFDSNGGTAPVPTSKPVTFDAAYGALPEVTRTGHTFNGWFTAPIGGTAITASSTVAIANNHTLVAQWTPNTYNVTFNANGGTAPSPTNIDVTYATLYGALPDTTRIGYSFNGWFTAPTEGSQVTATTTVTITDNQALYAQWTANTYTVTFDANGGEVPSPATIQVTYDQNYGTLATITREGHTFNGWFTTATGGTQVTTATTVALTADQTLFAQWTANTYTITFNANGGTAPSPATKQVTFGQTYGTLPDTTRSGYTFEGWFTQPSGGTEIFAATLVDDAENHTLYAQWTAKAYTLTFSANGGTSPVPVSKEVTFDQPYGTLATTTRTGYTFNGWFTAAEGGIQVTAATTVTATANHTLYAQWSLGVFLTWDSNGTGSGQTNGGGAWLGTNLWWNGTSNTNWVSGAAATFGGAATNGGSVTLASPTTLQSLTFNQHNGTYTLGTSGQTITLNAGIDKTATSSTVSIISPITLAADQIWANHSSGTLTTSNGSNLIDNNGFDLTVDVDGTGTTNFGVISNTAAAMTGSGRLIKNGTGRLNVGGVNSGLTGTVTINGGVMHVHNNNEPLGSGNLTINDGVMSFYWGATYSRSLGIGDNQVQILGGESGFAGSGTTGPSINLGSTVVWGSSGEGAATGFFNPSKFVLGDSGTGNAAVTTFTNGIDLNGVTRTIVVPKGLSSGGNTSTISGIISSTGTAGLVKEGGGTLILAAANTYNGNTAVQAGTLRLNFANTNNQSSTVSIAATASLHLNFFGTDTVDKLFVDGVQLAAGTYKAVGSAASGTELAQLIGTGTLTVTSGPPTGPGSVASFSIVGIPSQVTVGNTITGITITALDTNSQIATSFNSTAEFGGTAGITGTSANFVDGVLSGVSITPMVVDTGLTFTVDDGAGHTGSATFAVQSLFDSWAGNSDGNGTITFEGDANNDGVVDGLAWLIGSTDPTENANNRLPLGDEESGDLLVNFDCLKSAQRGSATLHFQYSNTLAPGSWTTVVVPETSSTVDGVVFVVTPIADSDLNRVEATVPAIHAGGTNKLFGRLSASLP